MFNDACGVEDCKERSRALLSNLCQFHDTIENARNLRAEDFDRLRDVLATTAPVTDDERNRRRGRSALRDIEWKARDLKAAKSRARSAGVTGGQIADAVRRGKSAA